MSDITFDMSKNKMKVHHERAEPWKVTLVDTGENSMTGGRLLRVKDFVKDEEAFCFTYGDGVGDNDIGKSLDFHKNHGKFATMTTSYPPGRFGAIEMDNEKITSFKEKPKGDGNMINSGFFVLSPDIFEYIKDDSTVWEQEPLIELAKNDQLMAFKHYGFWQPMDTLYDKNSLQAMWDQDIAPWKKWNS
jgi:glucose-1-phosphate cytidylyltransferase